MSKFGTKNTLPEYFWAVTLRNYCQIRNQRPGIFLIVKSIKIHTFGTK